MTRAWWEQVFEGRWDRGQGTALGPSSELSVPGDRATERGTGRGTGGGRPLGPSRPFLRVCVAVPWSDAGLPARRSCWPSGSCSEAPGACVGGCARWPCWGSCGCCVWEARWAARWPSTPSLSCSSRCRDRAGSLGGTGPSGHNPAALEWVPADGHLLSQEVSRGPVLCPVLGAQGPRALPGGHCPQGLDLSLPLGLSHTLWFVTFYFLVFSSPVCFPDTCGPPPFLREWNRRPGVDVSWEGCYLPVLPQVFHCGTGPVAPRPSVDPALPGDGCPW